MAKILSIETSCDETSIAVLDFSSLHQYSVLSHLTLSQAALHSQYGGVFPALAKREHQKNMIPLLFKSLEQAGMLVARSKPKPIDPNVLKKMSTILERESEILEKIILLAEQYKTPPIKAIPVTYGPGLEIALWTGFNTARALSVVWDCDLIPTNHMEGHVFASLVTGQKDGKHKIASIKYPSLALLVSGGHTELVLIKDKHDYKILGQTLDDAVGEAYDKSARLIGLPYPGGPHISQQATLARQTGGNKGTISLPRPMIHTKDCNFSFSGLKTAVLTEVQKQKRLSKQFKQQLCIEFEDAVSEVLVKKTKRAIEQYGVKNLIIGGGVSADPYIRQVMEELATEQSIGIYLPDRKLSGDNALMIGLAGYHRWKNNAYPKHVIKVQGNLSLNK